MVASNKTKQSMELETPRLGKFSYTEEDRFYAPSGIFGFSDEKHFIYHASQNIEPFIWLQSEDNLDLSLLLLDPRLCRADFSVEMNRSQLADLNLSENDQHAIYVIASVPEDFKNTTLNFKGPLIFNLTKHLFQQVIIEQEELRVPMFTNPK